VLVGRDSDCARIDDLLGRARRGRSASLLLRGEAGIGKTALLAYAAGRAEGMTVLRASGVESEAELQFSGLLELLRPLEAHLGEIPAQQAAALRSALGLGEAQTVDRFTVGAATLNLIAAAAEAKPLLVVVDDAQWLDVATSEALLFAAKRLVADAVALLFAAREDHGGFDLAGLDEVALRGLAPPDVATLLGSAAPEVARTLCAATRGNPLALLEARSLLTPAQLAGREPVPEPVPTGPTLERAFAGRVGALPPDTKRALVLAAVSLAHENGLQTLASALAELGLDLAALEAAEDAALIEIGEERVEFRHPIVRSAVFHGAAPSERRAAHRALAASLSERDGAEERAWHLAGAALGRDETAAVALEAAGRNAAKRSAYAAAAAAFTRSANLTADEPARLRRLHAAADAALRAGRVAEAGELLADPLASRTDPSFRADALRLKARIDYLLGKPEQASTQLLEASELLRQIDRGLAVEVCADACTTRQILGDSPGILAAAQRARALAAGTGDAETERLAAFTLGWVLCGVGRPREGLPLVDEAAPAVAGAAATLDPLRLLRASLPLDWRDRSREAFALAGRSVDRTRAQGAVGLLPYVLLQQAWHGVRAGFLNEGYAAAFEALGLARELDLLLPRMQALLILAAATARRGNDEECRRYADEVRPLAEQGGLHVFRVWLAYSFGVLALALGRLDEAASELETAAATLGERSLHSPSFVPRAELVEVYARAGRPDDAAAALAAFADSPEAESTLGVAAAARGRALLASNDDFERDLEEAFAAHERSDDVWSLARTRLCLGERLRRAGRRVAAREPLKLALEAFTEVAADPWAERARSELRATGETVKRRKAWEQEQLTPQELQIALHVARGLTNREVGAALFLSHKTVEFHLGRIYRKLDLHSRAELISRYAHVARLAETAAS
jgi:DNA-binding CsgD family transcriptional regulator/tetratricopeptide (TPR) repeat protein